VTHYQYIILTFVDGDLDQKKLVLVPVLGRVRTYREREELLAASSFEFLI